MSTLTVISKTYSKGRNRAKEKVGEIVVKYNGKEITTRFYEMKCGYISLAGFVGRVQGQEVYTRAVMGIQDGQLTQWLVSNKDEINVEYKFDLDSFKEILQYNYNEYYFPMSKI